MFEREFEGDAKFVPADQAVLWLRRHGYSVGVLQADAPRGILKGEFRIEKWRNLSAVDRTRLDGYLVFLPGGRVRVNIWRNAPAEGE